MLNATALFTICVYADKSKTSLAVIDLSAIARLSANLQHFS